jgi:hypothetical protein
MLALPCLMALSADVFTLANHNAVSVYTILKKLISELKMLVPDIRRIHYLTDSPTSQYRNKSIFRLISTHEEEFGVQSPSILQHLLLEDFLSVFSTLHIGASLYQRVLQIDLIRSQIQ